MAKKRNQSLRTKRDDHIRKKMNEGKGWAEKLLIEIREGVEGEEQPTKKRKGKRDGSRRLTNDSL